MIASIRDKALGLGGKIHPLMGPIFTGRPNATSTGDPCAMCVTPHATPADTVIRRRNGSKAYLCLEHDLMLHQAVSDLDRTMNAYEQQVLAQILYGADQPRWMPGKLYKRLLSRARHWAHVWTLHIIMDLTQRLFEQNEQRLNDASLRLRTETEKG